MAALRNGHLAIARMLMSCEAKLPDDADPSLVQVALSSINPCCLLLAPWDQDSCMYCLVLAFLG